MLRKILGLFLALVLLDVFLASGAEEEKVFTRTATEKLLAQIDFSTLKQKELRLSLQISPDGRRVAFVAKEGNKEFFVVDGKKQRAYDHVYDQLRDNIYFSPDSQRFAYVPSDKHKNFVVIDGKELKAYDEVLGKIHFSPDSRRIAYQARQGDEWLLVIDEKEEKLALGDDCPYDVIFSSDNRRVAYIPPYWWRKTKGSSNDGINSITDEVDESAKVSVILDGKYGKPYYSISNPCFSPDSKNLIYEAEVEKYKYVIVVNEKEGKLYDRIYPSEGYYFSPDGRRLAYMGKIEEQWRLVVDGKEGKLYDELKEVAFSPDSRQIAYKARRQNQWLFVIDEKEYLSKELLPPGNPFPYIEPLPEVSTIEEDQKQIAVINGKKGKPYKGIDGFYFSPDKKQVAYMALVNESTLWGCWVLWQEWILVINGVEAKKTYFSIHEPVFSPDSRRVAYVARSGGKLTAVIDGKEGKGYDEIEFPFYGIPFAHTFVPADSRVTFSPDSKLAAYVAISGSIFGDKWMVVVDETEGKPYDRIIIPAYQFKTRGPKIPFDTPDRFHYIAVKDNNIYLVEETIK